MSNERSGGAAPAAKSEAGKTEKAPLAWITGNLGADPVLRTTSKGVPVVNLRIGENKENQPTVWHNVAYFGKEAEAAAAALKKGSFVKVAGGFHDDSYEKDGVAVTAQKLIAEHVAVWDREKNDWHTLANKIREHKVEKAGEQSQDAPAQDAGAEQEDEQDLGR